MLNSSERHMKKANCVATFQIYTNPCIFQPDGGVDIEEVAEKTPERIKKVPVDIFTGVTQDMANDVANFLGFEGELQSQCAEQVFNQNYVAVL